MIQHEYMATYILSYIFVFPEISDFVQYLFLFLEPLFQLLLKMKTLNDTEEAFSHSQSFEMLDKLHSLNPV